MQSGLWAAKKSRNRSILRLFFVVGVTGFEPATFWSRTKRATKLRYTPKKWSQCGDSDPRPADYESAALPTELHWQLMLFNYRQTGLECQVIFTEIGSRFSIRRKKDCPFTNPKSGRACRTGFAHQAPAGTRIIRAPANA